jgi:zinc transporter
MSTSNDGLICAYRFDGRGGAREIGWEEIRGPDNDALIWVHLDRKHPGAQHWLSEGARLDALACEALLAEETRPRSLVLDEGMLVILRGVNLNPGSEPDDMISIRTWIDPRRIITLRFPKLKTIDDLRHEVSQGRAPRAPGDFLIMLSDRLLERMAPVLENLDDQLDAVEEAVLEAHSQDLRAELSTLRRQAITLRRHLAPQRDVLLRLQTETAAWLTDGHRRRLREQHDRLSRYVEDLDALRERAAVTHEELAGHLSEQMNKAMYSLSIVAGIFLPLGLLTGLLGINVGGMPGVDSDYAFTVVCAFLVVLAGLAVWIFRRFRFL